MSRTDHTPENITRINRADRKIQRGRPETMPADDKKLPLVVHAKRQEPLLAWILENHAEVEKSLQEHGGILFRGFSVGGLEPFGTLAESVGGKLEKYTYRSTPRTELRAGVYTSTEYPADKVIPFHNENSYSNSWPRKLFFYCELPSSEGGETPIADSHRVYNRIPAELRDKFIAKRVMYVRNYGEGVDLPWQEVFQTTDRSVVDAFCHEHGIIAEWKDAQRLRTRQICQAAIYHPDTGKPMWFNQAQLFHISSLEAEVREALLEAFSDEDLPRNSFFGDGSRISTEELDVIREAYRAEEVCFGWQKEDVLLVDNLAVAHSRKAFKGERKIRVAMIGSCESSTCSMHLPLRYGTGQ
jgi:alpha-ketoglutarate-dependent taurine dioxygenase